MMIQLMQNESELYFFNIEEIWELYLKFLNLM